MMLIGILLFISLLTPTAVVNAAAISENINIIITPLELRPADGGYVRVTGGYPMSVTISLDGDPLPVFWNNGAYMAFFAFDFEEPAGSHEIAITAINPITHELREENQTIEVIDYDFMVEELSIPYSLMDLFDPGLNVSETNTIIDIYDQAQLSPETDWPLSLPTLSPVITSRFGNDRIYGGGMWRQHHTGVDFRLGNGETVLAAADGWVIASDRMEVHGNFIAIDHGNGLITSYSHLSEKLVRDGMFVRRGQVIGLGGNTGRSSGPHLHMELSINGILVDPIRFMALTPGFVTPIEIKPDKEEVGN